MRRPVLLLLATVALAACGHQAHQETQTTVTKDGVTTTTITERTVDADRTSAHARADATGGTGLSIDSDKFQANVNIPGLSLGAEHMDLEGMKLYPGSTVKGMHVHAVDRPGVEKGEVVVNFAAPAAPLKVAQHFADQATSAGFHLTQNSAAAVAGTKPGDDGTHRFSVTLNPNGDGTVGVMTMTGSGRAAED